MSWASSRLPSRNQRVLTSSSRSPVKAHTSVSPEDRAAAVPGAGCTDTLAAGLFIPPPYQTRGSEGRIGRRAKKSRADRTRLGVGYDSDRDGVPLSRSES